MVIFKESNSGEIIIKCINCGSEFISKSNSQRYCTHKCQVTDYREKHREEIREHVHQYYLKNREKFLKRTKEWYFKNKSKAQHYHKNYRKIHRKEIDIKNYKYRKTVKEEVAKKLGNICYICNQTTKFPKFHEKYCRKHSTSKFYIRKHIKDFIVLCSTCHNSFHRYKRFKNKYEEVLQIAMP